MIPNQWLAVEVGAAVRMAPRGIRRFGTDLVLWRDAAGEVRCALDGCPHRRAALSRGRVVDGCLECPYHGLRFQSDGHCVRVPAHPDSGHEDRFRLRTYPTREARGLVWVWTGPSAPDDSLPWDGAFDAELCEGGGRFWSMVDTFDVSYLRVMENLTDYHHVAHVHRWSAPVSAEVTEFEASRDGRHVRTRGRLADGFVGSTHIVGPCLALLRFEGMATFAVVATPIDENHVWLYARYTQRLIQVPVVGDWLGWLVGQLDYRLLQRLQDLPVWRSQRLRDPADVRSYTLLPADEGVRLYFELHEELVP